MTRDEPEFQKLIEYITERSLTAAKKDKKDSFVEYLVDYSEIVDDYFSQRQALADDLNRENDLTIKRTLRNGFRSLYESLLDESHEYRRQVISAIVSAARGANNRDFHSIYIDLLSVLNRCYELEQQSGEMPFELKRFFVRRYSILLDQPLDELKSSETEQQLEDRYEVWKQAFTKAAELLRIMVEHSDNESYTHLVSQFTDFYPYEMVHSDGYSSDSEREQGSGLRAKKTEYGEKVRSDISIMTFVVTGWAFRLYKRDQISSETYSSIAAEIQSGNSSIEKVAETYYSKIQEPDTGGVGYWEDWNMNEALEEEMGVAVTPMSVHSWIRDYYCAELLRLGSESDWLTAQESERETPIPAVRQVINESEELRETFNQLREDSLAEFVTTEDTDLDTLIDALVQLHEDAAEQYRDDMRETIRAQDLEDSKKADFRASLKEQFDEECTLRNTMSTLSLITAGETGGESYHLVDLEIPRQKLVTVDAIPIVESIQRYANPIIERFSRLVFEELEFDPVQVNSNERVIRRIEEYTDSRGVEAILTSLGFTDQVFRDESNFDVFVPPDERIFENQRGTYAGTPVISIRYEEPVVVLLFDTAEQIVEPDPSEVPLEVEIEPGENTLSEGERSEMTEDEINQRRDFARAKVYYKGKFQPQGTTGVQIMVDDPS